MSIIAREWALHQKLGPVPKFVLLVLGDAANEQHACWLKVSTIAEKVGISRRTVQRTLQYLVQRKLVTIELRYRKDGGRSSNLYRLMLAGDANMAQGGVKLAWEGCHRCHRGGVRGVTPLTEKQTEREPPLPRQGDKPGPGTRPGPPGSGREDEKGKNTVLHYPGSLLPLERDRATVLVGSLDTPLQQQVLDEWAGIIAAREIRSSPLACLRALVKHAQEGRFTLERGIRVAQARKSRQRVLRQAENRPEPAPVDENNPLVHQVLEIRQRAREGRFTPQERGLRTSTEKQSLASKT